MPLSHREGGQCVQARTEDRQAVGLSTGWVDLGKSCKHLKFLMANCKILFKSLVKFSQFFKKVLTFWGAFYVLKRVSSDSRMKD